MSAAVDPVLQEVLDAAVMATAAAQGWLVVHDADTLRIVAGAGDDPGYLVGTTMPLGAGTAGFVVSSSQPLALVPRAGDVRLEGGIEALLPQKPLSILCVPCSVDDTAVGALQVVDKVGGGPFSFDDVELVTLLAGVGAVALATAVARVVPAPEHLAAELHRLARTDPGRYRVVATVIEELLDRG